MPKCLWAFIKIPREENPEVFLPELAMYLLWAGPGVGALGEAAQRCRPMDGMEEQEIPRNRGRLWCVVSILTLNKFWSQKPSAQTRDISPENNGALVPTVFDHRQFISGICSHVSACETHAGSVEKPGIKLVLWEIIF